MWTRLAFLIAFFAYDASAQFFTPGLGGVGQQCPYPMQMAPQIMPPITQQEENLRLRDQARQEARAIDLDIRKKMAEIRDARRAVVARLPGAAPIIFRHMENRGDGFSLVDCGGAPPIAPPPRVGPGYTQALSCPPPVARELPPAPPAQQGPPPVQQPPAPVVNEGGGPAAPDNPNNLKIIDNRQVNCERRPAGDTSLSLTKDQAPGVPAAGNSNDAPAPPVAGPGGQVFCIPHDEWMNHYAEPHGRVAGEICMDNRLAIGHGNPDACVESLDRLDGLYEDLANLHRDHDEYIGQAREYTEGGRRGLIRPTPLQNQFGNFMRTLSAMRGGSPGYPYPVPPSFGNYNYGAGNFGLGGAPYNGMYGFAPGGIPNGGFCGNNMNPALFNNPMMNAMLPPWANGVGPWGIPSGPQIRPLPGQGWPGMGGPQIRPIPYTGMGGMPGMPGVPGLAPGFPPRTIPLPGGAPGIGIGGIGAIGGFGGAPNVIGGVGVPSIGAGGYVPVPMVAPGASYGAQMGYMGSALTNWGGGAIPSYYNGVAGGYAGPGYTYQPSYFNMPSLGGAPNTRPLGPY